MGWTAAIPLITRLVNFTLDAIKKYQRRRDRAKKQKTVDKIHRNPAGYLKRNFGMRSNKSADKHRKNNAGKTGKTDD